MKIKILAPVAVTALFLMGGCSGKTITDKEVEKEPNQEKEVVKKEEVNPLLPAEFSKKVTDTLTTASGLKVVFKKQLNDVKPLKGDIVKVHYNGVLSNGKPFDNSYKRGQPFPFTLGQRQVIPGWDEGIALMGKGDMATLIIPPNLGYGDQDMGNGLIPPNSTLVFDVNLVDFTAGHRKYDITGKKPMITASGLKVYIIEPGDISKKPKVGQTAVANYAGYLTDGTKFDGSFDKNSPLEVPLGQGMVIKGWEEALLLMGVGSKYQVHIPPSLGYGAQGKGPIPGNSTLIFDMELVGIK